MDKHTKIVFDILNLNAEYKQDNEFNIRLSKTISHCPTIKHYINSLEIEALKELNKTGKQMISKVSLHKVSLHKVKPQDKSIISNKSTSLPTLEIKFQLPNIIAGKQFIEKAIPLEELPGELQLFDIKGHEKIIGLSINEDDMIFEGKIDVSGDYKLDLMYVLLLPSGEKQKVKGNLKFSVIPDPRSLWKNIPSDNKAKYHKPDQRSEACKNDSVNLIASSVRGRSHEHKGIHRDDDIKIHCSQTSQWNIACVADGAGSCKYSRRGAELAVIHAVDTLKETLNGNYGIELENAFFEYKSNNTEENNQTLKEIYQHTIIKSIFNVITSIRNEGIDNPKDFNSKDFSTTLLLTAHKKLKNSHLILSFWVGDGAIAVYDKNNSIKLLGVPDSGEYAGQTRFLDERIFENGEAYNRVRIQEVESMTALILATDGITDAWFETEKQLGTLEHWDNLWSELEPFVHENDSTKAKEDLTKWMEFWSQGNHDDRSIAICYVKDK
ncbi:MAG: PP2C family serine/threonine-protein phosphatase [Cycloclasticus sp.]|nr:PP2C family serine/threonine-protein phosphatase [Cycloclasticus sp.]